MRDRMMKVYDEKGRMSQHEEWMDSVVTLGGSFRKASFFFSTADRDFPLPRFLSCLLEPPEGFDFVGVNRRNASRSMGDDDDDDDDDPAGGSEDCIGQVRR